MRSDLFRPEAVAAHAEAAGAGRKLPTSRRLLFRATAALAVALVIAIALAALIEVDETAEGTWTGVGVDVPVGALNRLELGQRVRIDGVAGGTVSGAPQPVPGPGGTPRAVVPVQLDGAPPPKDAGKAVVVLDRRSLLDLVVDAFGRGFRRG